MKHEASYAASCYFCLFHSGSPYFVSGCRFVSFKIAASGARALLAMTNLIGFAGKRNNFRFEKRAARRRPRFSEGEISLRGRPARFRH